MSDKLEELRRLEIEKSGQLQQETSEVVEEVTNENETDTVPTKKLKKEYNVIDGYRKLETLPFDGMFYPKNWEFFYRCPTVSEVANFSTIEDGNQAKIISTVSELIRKCFIIVNRETESEISPKQINDGERLFFFLKLREFYLNEEPIQYQTLSMELGEMVTVDFLAESLIYKKPKALLQYFDGRKFNIPVAGTEKTISFLIPTLDIQEKIYRYVSKTFKSIAESENSKSEEEFNKKFLLFLQFLYETGNETVESLKLKYKNIEKDEELYDAYLTLINKINLTNSENLKYTIDGVEEVAPIKFPGGWKNIFTRDAFFGDIF